MRFPRHKSPRGYVSDCVMPSAGTSWQTSGDSSRRAAIPGLTPSEVVHESATRLLFLSIRNNVDSIYALRIPTRSRIGLGRLIKEPRTLLRSACLCWTTVMPGENQAARCSQSVILSVSERVLGRNYVARSPSGGATAPGPSAVSFPVHSTHTGSTSPQSARRTGRTRYAGR